eukprot:6407605-Prorocentrum_lima.AAC.1
MSKADCLEVVPSHTPQFLGLLVDVAVDQLVHELDLVNGHDLVHEIDLVHGHDLDHHAVLNILDE